MSAGAGFIGLLPKSLGNRYFTAARAGADEAAREQGFVLRWEGPQEADASAQAAIVERWVRDGASVIAASVEDPSVVSPALRSARAKGVRVVTWDADAEKDARDLTVAPATAEGIAQALAFEVGRMTGEAGEVAVITSTESAPNQARWLALLRERLASASPGARVVAVRSCHDEQERASEETRGLLEAHPDLKVIVGLCAPAVPGVARVLAQAKRKVRLTGISSVDACRGDLESGQVDSIVTWSPRDLGYLAAFVSRAVASGDLGAGTLVFRAGRLGNVVVQGDEVRLGRPRIITRGNLDSFAG